MFDFMFGHHGDPNWSTNNSNIDGFEALKLRPRVLVDVSRRDLSTTVLGHPIAFPVIVGPVGGQKTVHPEAEVASARAAGSAKTLFVLPCNPSYAFDEVARAATGPRWFQVFIHKDRGVTEHLVRRAHETGYTALIVTVSHAGAPFWRQGRTPTREVVRNNEPAPTLAGLDRPNVPSIQDIQAMVDPSVNWSDVHWLRSITKVPLIIKGIQTAEDARLCVDSGADAIVVSNHGGRFLQSARGTIQALPEVVEAVDSHLEVYLDGGIRQGTDILKALALGARAVLIGRAVFWGLSVGGQDGVYRVLEILRSELDAAMGLCGLPNINAITKTVVSSQLSGPNLVKSLERA
jgi:4-hydroxymandelate oxidase